MEEEILESWLKLFSELNESQRRKTAGQKALEFGWGGISKVSNLTKISMDTIRKGISELKSKEEFDISRIRKKGGGRKKIIEKFPEIKTEILNILENNTIGDPMKTLKWTSKSTIKIAKILQEKGYKISEDTVGVFLKKINYSLQQNRKQFEGDSKISPEKRDSQFKYINKYSSKIKKKDVLLSVDCKKKELVGNFKNNGRKWQKKGESEKVNVYDFPSLAKGKAIPYGTYDIKKNKGFVNVGINHDTAEFAVESLFQWYEQFGKYEYPNMKELVICADGGGSNSSRSRLYKFFLQRFVNKYKIKITVLHFPPGTSKWNKIEHKLFSFVSMNWKGEPLRTYQIILNFINTTITKSKTDLPDLKVSARLDKREYKTGIKISDEEFNNINLKRHSVNPEWNYSILPQIS